MYLQCTAIFRQCSEHTVKQNTLMPNTAYLCCCSTVPSLSTIPKGNTLTFKDCMPIAFNNNKSIVILVELLLWKPSNV